MNNTVLTESKLRQKLKLACALMCIICLSFIIFVVIVVMIDKQNLNGQTDEISGILSEVYINDTNTVTIDDDKLYNVVWDDKENGINLNDYLNKTVTLIVTRDTFSSSNPWALGLVADGQTVVDYKSTLDSKIASNNEIKTVLIAVTSILCVATCGLFIWRFNLQPLVERALYKEFAEFLSARQPTCKQRKWTIMYVVVYFALLLALFITVVLIDPDAETIPELMPEAKTVLWALLAVAVVGGIGLLVFKEWITYKEIEFYSKKMPFDFSDISHAPLRKKVKEQLQQEILNDFAEHPHTYADGGNGYDVTFGEKGVTLSIPTENYGEPVEIPRADEVFLYNDREIQPNGFTAANNVFGASNGLQQDTMTLTYDQLNFEAVAYFRKNSRPMMIIVKSRLNRTDDFPEEFVNDIHIAFDLNLHRTLKEFNVEVENLQYLIDNKKRLMLENCLYFRKNKSKIAR